MVKINSIDKVFEDFKFFFKTNNVPVYHIMEKQGSNADHDHNFMDIEEIKSFIIAVKPKYVQLCVDKFEIDEELDSNLLTENEERQRFQELSSDLKAINNSFIDFTIMLPISTSQNPSFGFVCDRFDEISEYIYLGNKIIQNGNETITNKNNVSNKEDNEEWEETDNNKIEFKKLTKEETESYINRLLNEEEFVSTSLSAHRRDFIKEFFEKELNHLNIYHLIDKAERALEQSIKNKIQELKKQGKRKFEITGELGISKHRVDKYF